MTTPSRRATESQAGGRVPPVGEAGKLRRIDRAITHPGSVKINVEGAFIVDEETTSKNDTGEGIQYEHKDIRLPHHTSVVSHVAVDVS
jgi:type II pantothenate kinase